MSDHNAERRHECELEEFRGLVVDRDREIERLQAVLYKIAYSKEARIFNPQLFGSWAEMIAQKELKPEPATPAVTPPTPAIFNCILWPGCGCPRGTMVSNCPGLAALRAEP